MDLDLTIIVQFLILATLILVLHVLVLNPLRRVLDEREKKMEGAATKTDDLQLEASADLEAYQKRMRGARDEAQKVREEILDAGRQEERKITAEARAEIAEKMNKARTEVATAERAARDVLEKEADQIANDILGRLLSKKEAA